MDKFDDTEIEEHKFYRHNSPVLINEIDITEIAIFNKLHKLNKLLTRFSIFHWLQRQ